MKQLIFAVAGIAATLFFSCTNFHFDKSYYYNTSPNSLDIMPESIIEIDGLPEDVDDSEIDWFSEGEWNDINYQFDGSKIKDWFFHVSFDDNTVPTYQFKEICSGHGAWTDGNTQKNEKTSKSPDKENTAQGYGITEMTVYRYDGKNPLVGANTSYNAAGGRMGRFHFYRIKGKSVVVALDQYLIAVDTYSKFVFAYGKITGTTTVAGKLVPINFEALDVHEAVAGETAGKKKPFYQYDPIGFVKGDGTVVLYKEYRDEMGNATTGQTKYFPRVHDASRAVAQYEDENSSGCSPYFSQGNSDASSSNAFIDAVARKTYRLRQKVDYSYKDKNENTVYVNGYGYVLYLWQFDSTGKKLTLNKIDTGNNKTTVTSETYTYDESKEDDRGVYKNDSATIDIRYDGAALYRNGEKVGEALYKDPGPDFLLRVRGATFTSLDNKVTYAFSDDGGKLNVGGIGKRYGTNCDGTYWYDASPRESIGTDIAASYSGGPADYTMMRLSNSDFIIASKLKVANYSDPAYRQIGDIAESDPTTKVFFTMVYGRTYQKRLKVNHPVAGEINGWIFREYQFSNGGKTLSVVETNGSDYQNKLTATEYTFDSIVNETEAKYKNMQTGTIHTFSVYDDSLSEDGVVCGEFGYADPGVHFLLRVAGWTFHVGDTKYVFSDDGITLDLTYKGLDKVVVKTIKNVTRTWNGNSSDTTETTYGGVLTRLIDDDSYIQTKMTAYGWGGSTWEYKAPRRVKSN
ncbi:MAG: hypothetical protein J6I73_05135 [Treponema sp.]|nr:hypothetical protein [Treponema sp.]